jgi:hypothetical protein
MSFNSSEVIDAGTPGESLISVREASRLLGWSKWRVYKLNRVAGPFRFVKDGHRVFLDEATVKAYMLRRPAAPNRAYVTSPDAPSDPPMPTTSSRNECPGSQPKPAGSSGQREVFSRPTRHRTGILCYAIIL